MARPDDQSLPVRARADVQKHAEKLLREAGALGVFPTPVDQLMDTAQVEVDESTFGDIGFFDRLRKMTQAKGGILKRALDKVMGVFHAAARIIYIDPAIHYAKKTFLKLHETGHAVLPWQRDIYMVTEDCKQTLDPEIKEQFEREANVFAADVVFQLDSFNKEANDYEFGVKVPLRLQRQYGSSVYMAMRRYVHGHHRACAVLVLDPPEMDGVEGFTASRRRVVVSKAFAESFGDLSWPESFSPGDDIGNAVPIGGRKMSSPRELFLRDGNGSMHLCMAEGFTQSYQVFILIHAIETLTRKSILLPSGEWHL